MMRDCVIGVDCGTSAVKAVVWDAAGNALGQGRVPLVIDNPRPSCYEQDADSWVDGVYRAVRQAVDAAGKDAYVHALCVTHQRETFVPAGKRPIHKAILWMDGRADGLVEDLRSRIDGERFRSITGKTLSGNLTLTKLEWLRRQEPELYAAASCFCDVQAFVLKALVGQAVTGPGSADPTGLFDMPACIWSAEILDMIGLDVTRLPVIAETGSVAGHVCEDAARSCGLAKGLPVIVGLGDGQSAGLGCGIAGGGESCLSLGTSIVSGTSGRTYISAPEFRTSFGGVPRSYFFETVILSGAHTLSWFLDRFCRGTEEPDLREKARDLHPGSDGLMLVPYLSGAMNPYWDADARGIMVGLSASHGPEHVYRAILEGMSFEQRLHSDGVEKALAGRDAAAVTRYVVSGGGAANGLWLHILADVTGRQVQRSRAVEAGALGAGMLAATAAGLYPDVEHAAAGMSGRDPRVIEPDTAAHARYDELYFAIYTRLYPAVAGITGRRYP